MSVHRGEIWLVNFGEPVGVEQAGVRPAVIISTDRFNRSRAELVITIPCTTRHRDLPSHIEIDPASSGLDEVSYAKCEDVKSISRQRLIRRIGNTEPADMFRIERAVEFFMGLA